MDEVRADSSTGHSNDEHGVRKASDVDDLPNPFAADDARRRLCENYKTKEFMKDPGFLEKLDYLSKSSQNLVHHVADHRVMTALAVLLDVDVTVPEHKQQDEPEQDSQVMLDGPKEASIAGDQRQEGRKSTEPTSALPTRASDRIEMCKKLKDEGNQLFQKKEWKKALKKYHHAIMYVKCVSDKLDCLPGLEASLGRQPASKEEQEAATQLMLSLWNNISLCLLKLEDWEKVIKHTSKVLFEKQDDAKALYRRGTAYIKIGKVEEAEDDLRKAEKLNPGDKLVKQQMETVQKKKLEQQAKDKKMYTAMFS